MKEEMEANLNRLGSGQETAIPNSEALLIQQESVDSRLEKQDNAVWHDGSCASL